MEERARPRTLRRVATETRRDRQVCDASRQKQGAIARFATRRDGNKARSPGLRRVATETRRDRQVCDASRRRKDEPTNFATIFSTSRGLLPCGKLSFVHLRFSRVVESRGRNRIQSLRTRMPWRLFADSIATLLLENRDELGLPTDVEACLRASIAN